MNDQHENYRKTVALYCKDIIDELRDKPDFIAEVRALDKMIMEAPGPSADGSLMCDMAEAMARVHERAMVLYARYPQSRFLEGIIGRAESVRRMCRDCAG